MFINNNLGALIFPSRLYSLIYKVFRILNTDASDYGIGAVITHHFPNGEDRPIAYSSKDTVIS